MLRLLRNLFESVVMGLLFGPWLVIAIVSWLYGRLVRRALPKRSFRSALRRWLLWLRKGLRPYREVWWPLPKYESYGIFWYHFVVVEWFSALNLSGMRRRNREAYLVVKLAHIGDAMHIGPMLRMLARHRPSAKIDLLVGPWCADLAKRWNMPGRLWEYTPRLHLFHRGNRRTVRSIWSEWTFLWQLRRVRYSCCLSTSTLSMSELMLIVAAAPSSWVGASNPIAAYYREIPDDTEPYHSRQYEADRVAGLLHHLDMVTTKVLPDYPIHEDERMWAASIWQNARQRVVIAPGAGWPGKMWPAERFGEVAQSIAQREHVQIVLTGAPDEKSLANAIVSACPSVINLMGETSMGQTAALIATASLFLGNDSGPLHLAASFGTPSITLFGPTVASKWHPPGQQHQMIQKSGFCDGCVGWHPAASCLHGGACMKAISVDEVLALVEAQLGVKTGNHMPIMEVLDEA
jgi:ADP-heptose:LPS heptosyltransferase